MSESYVKVSFDEAVNLVKNVKNSVLQNISLTGGMMALVVFTINNKISSEFIIENCHWELQKSQMCLEFDQRGRRHLNIDEKIIEVSVDDLNISISTENFILTMELRQLDSGISDVFDVIQFIRPGSPSYYYHG